MDITTIASGRATKVTAFGKVEGQDTTYAKIQSMKFKLGKGTAGAVKVLAQSGDLPANVVEETATKVKYKSVWDLTLPTLERGVEHRIWAELKCVKKLAFDPGITGNSVVLGARTENVSIFSKLFAFLVNLGPGEKGSTVTPTPTPNTLAKAEETVSKGQVLGETRRDKLQLETFIPGEVTKKSCTTIYFKIK